MSPAAVEGAGHTTSAVLAGLVTSLVGFSSSFALVLAGLTAQGASTRQAASGLLVDKFGGPSVKPIEPPGYLGAMNFPKRPCLMTIGLAQLGQTSSVGSSGSRPLPLRSRVYLHSG